MYHVHLNNRNASGVVDKQKSLTQTAEDGIRGSTNSMLWWPKIFVPCELILQMLLIILPIKPL